MLSSDTMDPENNNFHSELNKLLKHFSVNKNKTMTLPHVFLLHYMENLKLSNLNLISQFLYYQKIRMYCVYTHTI